MQVKYDENKQVRVNNGPTVCQAVSSDYNGPIYVTLSVQTIQQTYERLSVETLQ